MSGRMKDGRSTRWKSFKRRSFPCGTVAKYVSGCRCQPCRDSHTAKANARAAQVRQLAPSVVPNGPPGTRVVMKLDGHGQMRRFVFKKCPGTGGQPCVRGGACLRQLPNGSHVCLACVERATVWNGLVDATPATRHLLAMRAKGIGYKAVADAASVARSLCQEIVTGKVKRIRAQTLRRILTTDEGCRADGNRVPAEPTKKLVQRILIRGFTQTWLSRQLGCGVYIFSKKAWSEKTAVLASTALKVEKLWRRIKAGELKPRPRWVDAGASWRRLRAILDAGATFGELSKRLSYTVQAKTLQLARVRPETEEKIRALYDEWVANEGELSRPTYDDKLSIDDFATARDGATA